MTNFDAALADVVPAPAGVGQFRQTSPSAACAAVTYVREPERTCCKIHQGKEESCRIRS